MAVFEAC
jgi:proteasome lid subunit RPN8/RPN11